MTNLEAFVTTQSLCDTHEHLSREDDYCRWAPDILADLFGYYTCNDLVAAGASEEAMKRMLDSSDPDVPARFAGIREAWERCQFTGYGQGTRLMARLAYGMDAINPDTLIEAHRIHSQRNRSGERLRLLRDQARLDHVQVDLMHWDIGPDPHAPGFFFYDLSIRDFATGNFDLHQLAAASGVVVRDLATLREAMTGLFARHVRHVVAVKTQHAYDRSLAWAERNDSDASAVLSRKIAGQNLEPREKDCLGDWTLNQAITLATKHGLPVKIHTGYLARNGYMQIDQVRVGQLCPLLSRHPKARFVLMHIASGYEHELLAIAKHYPNVFIDFCWAWTINPLTASRFLRACLHQVPIHRVFAFGGDAGTPTAALAYAYQARQGLLHALDEEIAEHWLNEAEAISIARRIMHDNQYETFGIAALRQRLHPSATTTTFQ